MKFTISKNELLDSLRIISKGLSSRSTLPILSGILLTVSDGNVSFQSTDLEVSVKHTVASLTETPGQVVVPGKLFTDIIGTLPDAAVEISLQDRLLKVECIQSSFTLKTLNASDFPRFPEVKADKTVSIPATLASSMVRQVSKAVSRDESRAILTGILFSIEGDHLKFVATDSYRLAIRETILEKSAGEPVEVVIPGKILEEIMKAASGAEEVSIGISENQIIFSFGSTVFVTRRIEGNFPNYKQLLPKEHATTATIQTSELLLSVKRVSLLAQNQSSIKLSVSAADQNVNLSSNTAEVGTATEDLMAKVDGEDVEIAFNYQYLLDGLNSVPTDEVILEVQSSNRPGIFKATGEEIFIYLAMPVRLG